MSGPRPDDLDTPEDYARLLEAWEAWRSVDEGR